MSMMGDLNYFLGL